MNHSKLQTQRVGNHDRSFCPSFIRRHHNAIFPIWNVLLDPTAEQRFNLTKKDYYLIIKCRSFLQTINWMVKKSLQLWRMWIQHHQMICSSSLQHVGHQLGCYWRTERRLLVTLAQIVFIFVLILNFNQTLEYGK